MAYYVVPEFDGYVRNNRIIWETAGEMVYLEPYGKDALRFRASKSLRIDEELNWTLQAPERAGHVQIDVDKERARIVNGKITATITGDGTVTYYKTETEEILLQEYWIDGRVHTAPGYFWRSVSD